MNVYKIFQNNLNKALVEQNKQQKHLAQFLGIDPTRVSSWIRTQSNPKLSHLAGTSQFLNTSLDYLILDKKNDCNFDNLTDQEQELLSNFRNLEFKEQIEVLYFTLKLNKKNKG